MRSGRIALAAVLGAGLLLAPAGMARRIAINTIDPVATVSQDGRRVFVTGPLACTQTEHVDLRVTVTQGWTVEGQAGVVAHGRLRFTGTSAIQRWEVEATVEGNETFVPGAATAVGLAVTSVRGVSNDAHQWLVNVMLVRE